MVVLAATIDQARCRVDKPGDQQAVTVIDAGLCEAIYELNGCRLVVIELRMARK